MMVYFKTLQLVNDSRDSATISNKNEVKDECIKERVAQLAARRLSAPEIQVQTLPGAN